MDTVLPLLPVTDKGSFVPAPGNQAGFESYSNRSDENDVTVKLFATSAFTYLKS